ncbi:MAG: hypothetical protein AMXMBFR53_40450 [Gemmatimonadota bacterium]
MTEPRKAPGTGRVGLLAGALVATGIALGVLVSMGFLVLAGLGAFGPGILRELGWIEDHDEFQRQAARRAGYHAYLVGGLGAVVITAALKFREASLDGPAIWVALVVVLLWSTWLFSSLMTYWGARRTTTRVLWAFGAFWLLFAMADLVSEPSLVGALWALSVVAPYFILGWAAQRWPKPTGVALLAVSAVGFGHFFDFGRGFIGRPGQVMTFVILLLPMLACGVALVKEAPLEDDG